MKKEKIIVVDKEDKVLGLKDKDKCHQGKGILHRAIFVLIFNQEGQILLTKRSKDKKLWPLVWDGACASHPYPGESYLACAKRRIKEELGLDARTCSGNPKQVLASKLKFLFKFQYQASYKNTCLPAGRVGSENEICAVFVGQINSQIKPNPVEVADWQWIGLDSLQREIKKNPAKYTPWLKIALKKYFK